MSADPLVCAEVARLGDVTFEAVERFRDAVAEVAVAIQHDGDTEEFLRLLDARAAAYRDLTKAIRDLASLAAGGAR